MVLQNLAELGPFLGHPRGLLASEGSPGMEQATHNFDIWSCSIEHEDRPCDSLSLRILVSPFVTFCGFKFEGLEGFYCIMNLPLL